MLLTNKYDNRVPDIWPINNIMMQTYFVKNNDNRGVSGRGFQICNVLTNLEYIFQQKSYIIGLPFKM